MRRANKRPLAGFNRSSWLSSCLLLIAVLAVLPGALALHEADVGVVDWHKRLVGVPLVGGRSLAPSFRIVDGLRTNESSGDAEAGKRHLVFTATGNNVLAAVDPVDGSVAWRYVYEPEDWIAGYYKDDTHNIIASLSGPGGSTLRAFEAATGHLVLEKQLHSPSEGHLSEPHHLGKFAAFERQHGSGLPHLYVLTNGHTIRKIDANTAETLWKWSSPDQTSLTIYSKLVATPSAIYAIGVSKSFASFTLHVTSLSPSSGEVLASTEVPSSVKEAVTQFLVLRSDDVIRLVWLDQGTTIASVPLMPSLAGPSRKPVAMKGKGYSNVLDLGPVVGEQLGYFIAMKPDGVARVVRLAGGAGASELDPGLKGIWEFGKSKEAGEDDVSDSVFAGAVAENGRLVLARAYWSHSSRKAKMELYSPAFGEAKSHTSELAFGFDTLSHGIIGHVALEATFSSSGDLTTRALVTSSTGSLQLWQGEELKWTREESLAAVLLAEFLELPEEKDGMGVDRAKETFANRVTRQIADAKDFPKYVLHFVKRFLTGSYDTPVTVSSATATDGQHLARDTFGFRQVVVAATGFGKIFGIDSSNGRILWSRVMGLGWAEAVGGRLHPVKMFVVKSVGDNGDGEADVGDVVAGGPEVAVVVQRTAENGLVDTVIFHVDALTGKDVNHAAKSNDDGRSVLEGVDVISGPLVESHLLQTESRKIVVLLDEYLQVYLYPDTPETQAAFKKLAPKLHLPLRASVGDDAQASDASAAPPPRRRLMGHQFALDPALSDRHVAYSTWTFSLPEDEDVMALIPPAGRGRPVASFGKVLGNRTTLYKYLNDRLVVLLTKPVSVPGAATSVKPTKASAGRPKTCGVYVLDSVKGSLIYRATVPARSSPPALGSRTPECDVKASLAENWLVYRYYDEGFGAEGTTKGWRIVTVEFYEGDAVDEKTRSSDMSSYSQDALNVRAIEQSFIYPFEITAMATTQTKFGITLKDLIVATRNHQVQSIPRRLLDPRRPNRKPTAEEQEEFLIPYDPVLHYDPKRVLSHNYEVANAYKIITTPALLESTSLVLVFGLDMFLTRVAPSNTFDVLSESFNKAQLVFTVAGLALAIVITKPMVKRKLLREKWYQ